MNPNRLEEFLDFIRFKLCIFAPVLAMSGYFLRNDLHAISLRISPLILSSFFLCAGAYAYNSITDKEEDRINKKKINFFALHGSGYVIVSGLMFMGLFGAFFLPPYSRFFAMIFLAVGIAYSFFRLKKYILIKNLYTGFGLAPFFLMGASEASFTIEMFFYYILLSVFITIGSVISDLRDYNGDKLSGVRTLPVHFGYKKARHMVMLFLAVYSVSILNFRELLILLPFIFLMLLAIKMDKPSLAHSLSGYSFVSMMLWMMIF